eukprot:2655354-Lingulodinium_polyedra.AAC.1
MEDFEAQDELLDPEEADELDNAAAAFADAPEALALIRDTRVRLAERRGKGGPGKGRKGGPGKGRA